MDYSYPVIIKKKTSKAKNKRKIDTGQFTLPPNEHDSERLLIGQFLLGQVSKNYPDCLSNFDELPTHTHVDILQDDDADVIGIMRNKILLYAIVLQVDTAFILGLLKTRQFYFRVSLKEDNEDVIVKVYFREEPSEQQQQSSARRQIVKQLFQLLLGVGVQPLSKDDTKSNTQDDVDKALQLIRNKQLQLQENTSEPQSNFQQSKWLKSKLRPYQEAGVQWMLNKEKTAQTTNETKNIPHPGYIEVQLPSIKVYLDQEHGYVCMQPLELEVCTTGAILADEMGLGKTIEVLALILSDFNGEEDTSKDSDDCASDFEVESDEEVETRKGKVHIHRQRKRPKYEVTDMQDMYKEVCDDSGKKAKLEPGKNRERLMQLYENVLVSVWDKKVKPEQDVACICGSFEKKNLKMCVDCGKNQHYNCVGYDESCGPFRCSQCWSKQEPLESKGTLIVCPASLFQQWLNEITKHVACKLQIFCYDGSTNLTPVYPTKLASYDIVVTTYSVLQGEFYLADQCAGKSLRHQRKYSSPGSPITLVKFRRLCLDEAQTVDSVSSIIAAMAQRLRANFRWAITGTPVSISISDLYGLIEYLGLSPYNDPKVFNSVLYHPYLRGDETHLVNFLAEVLWRTRKLDVLDQINIPPQTVKHHLIDFTQVERYFYDCETREAKNIFLERASKLDASTPLMKMLRKDLKDLLQPISAVRRVCVHHNVVKGKYLLTKKPVNSMQELLDALIARNVNDCDDHLRAITAGNNGLAGVYLLLNNPLTAAMHYVRVMELEKKYSKKDVDVTETGLTIDKLPLIHMYYNLRPLVMSDENLSQNLSELMRMEVVLKGDELKARQELLEHEYVNKFEHQTRQVLKTLGETSDSLLEAESRIEVPSWYADLYAMTSEGRLRNALQKHVFNLLENLKNTNFRPSYCFNIEFVLDWIESIKTHREVAMEAVNDLYEITSNDRITFTDDVVHQTVKCHLRPEKPTKKKTQNIECNFCAANKLLQQYEEVLYHKDLSGTGKQRNWVASVQELTISGVLKIASRKADTKARESGQVFLEMLELQKKEFRELRKLWTYLEAQLCANDELVMCKIRLQLKNKEVDDAPEMHRSLKELSNEIKNNLDGINELTEFEIDGYRFNLEGEIRSHSALLEKCLGTNKYLRSLHSNGRMLDPCPICRCPLEKSWNIMQCGHAFCLICMETIIGRNRANPGDPSQKITCAVCRQVQPLREISCIDETLNDPVVEDREAVNGNCSSKVEHIVRLIKQLKLDEPGVKVLVFTSFLPVLQILNDIFEQNGINSVMVKSNPQVDKRVESFKQKGVTALVLPVNLGAKGLNLIEATHVIFAEPILDPAEELQAIGRVHRIGQKKKTVVHKFIMKDSIEAGIQRATSSKEKSKWSRTEITVGQLNDLLFGAWESDDCISTD